MYLADLQPSAFFGWIYILAFIASAVYFFQGPAKAADRYLTALQGRFDNQADAALFLRIYRSKGPKSTLAAWLLTILLTPTISYIYQGRWGPAVIAFLTFQGLGLWWLVSIFTMPLEVMHRNKKKADEAYNEVALARAGSYRREEAPISSITSFS